MDVTGLKSRDRAVFLLEAQEVPFPCLFQLPEASYITLFMALHHSDLSHSHLSFSVLDPLPFSFTRTL